MHTALITGAGRGIGLALAEECVRRGWRVVATGRAPAPPPELAAARERYGDDRLRWTRLDLVDDARIEALADSLSGESVDFLVNNAFGGGRSQPFPHITYEAWEQSMRINVYAPLKLAQALLEPVARSERKTIVAISSRMASMAEEQDGSRYAYRTAKVALNMVVRNLAAQLAPRGVTVASIHPGWVRTALGGPGAPLSPAQSARAVASVIDGLGPGDSGRFLDHEGKEIPW
ncbi:SDR family oxidoreductase [Streptomyces daliensis]